MSMFPISFTIDNPILVAISETVRVDIVMIGYIFTFFYWYGGWFVCKQLGL